MVTSLLIKLEWLDLSGALTSDADINATWLTTFVDALSAHCPHLRDLNLSDNNLGIPGASALSRTCVTDYSTCGEPSDHTCRLKHIRLDNTNIGDKGLVILIKNFNVVSTLSLKGNNIHFFGVSCLADTVCLAKLKLEYRHLYLSDNPLGLEGSLAVGRIISSSHCQVDLSRCELTTAGINLSCTGSLNTTSSVAVRDIGQQLCQMPQSGTILILELSGNSFTGEGIHILASFIHLCPWHV